MSPRKSKEEEQPAGAPAYMSLYSTLMTLLMAFFVVLCTMGTFGGERFDRAATSMNKWFTVLPSGGFGMLSQKSASIGRVAPHFKMGAPKVTAILGGTEVESALKSTIEEGVQDLQVLYFRDGSILINVPDRIFFERGSTILRQQSFAFLNKLLTLLADHPYKITVRGHTDNTFEPGNIYASNWELSVLRASRIIRYLNERGGIDFEYLLNEGFAGNRPIFLADDQLHRNRRIEFLLEKL